MDPIPDTRTSNDISHLLKSVFIPAVPKDSRARQIAEAANDPVNADSFLRGKAEFDQGSSRASIYCSPIHPRMARSVFAMRTRIS
jgi:hypothetical protein